MRTAQPDQARSSTGSSSSSSSARCSPTRDWLDRGEEAQGPGRGGDRPDRHRQLHAQAAPPGRLPRDRRQRPLDPRRGAQARPRLGPAQGDRRPDHQAPAPLPLDLDLPGLEPRLQRLGRVGRPRGQVRVDQAGDQVRPGRRREEPAVARPDLGHRLVSTTTSSASPTSRSSSAASSATTRTRTSRPTAIPRRGINVVSNDNFQLGYGWFSRAVGLVDEGASRLDDGHRRDAAGRVRRPDAPAQGAARRPRLPLDARPRPDPLRRRPREDEHRWASRPPSARSPRTSGPGRFDEWVKFGQHEFESPNEINRDGKLVRDTIQHRRSHRARASSSKLNENQQYWTDRWADQMNYPLLEGPVPWPR